MTYVFRLLLAFLPVFLCLQQVAGQELSCHHFTTDDGLPSSEVYYVYQDSKGFIWMATDHGLARYDGYGFKTFNTNNGLPDNTIFRIAEQPDGILLVQTFSKGIYQFNGQEFTPHPKNEWLLKRCGIKQMHAYEVYKDTLIVSTIIDLFGCSQKDTFSYWKIHGSDWYKSAHLYLNYMVIPNRKVMYTLSERPLPDITPPAGYRCGHLKLYYPGERYGDLSFTYLGDDKFALHVDNYLYFFTAGDSTAVKYRTFATRIISVTHAPTGELWVGLYQNGVVKLNAFDKDTSNDKHYFPEYSISCTTIDAENNFWFTTLEDGALFVPGINFNKLLLGDNENHLLPTKALSLLAYRQYLYTGSDKNCIYRLDSLNRLSAQQMHERQSRVEDMAVYKNTVRASSFFENINNKDLCGTAPLSITVLPGEDSIILGGHNGYSILQNNRVIRCSSAEGFTPRIQATYYQPGLGILLGTNQGVYRLQNNVLSYFFADSLLKNIRVTDIKAVPAGGIIITTRGEGLFYINGTKRINITEKENLISNLIEKVYVENDTSYWVATYSGLSHVIVDFTRQSVKPVIESYTKREGLSSNEINDIEMFRGEIWLATNNGLCHFKPGLVKKALAGFPLYLTSVIINGQIRDSASLQNLQPSENNLVFELTGLNYKSRGSINYHYVLQGHTRFEGVSKTRRISFIGLEPGAYKISVTAIAATGDTSLHPITLNFTIPPYFTRTGWFIALIVVAILVGILSIVYLYYQNLTIKNETRTQVIEAEQAALRSQMNPHFIFNVLNSIQSFLGENDKKQAQNFLGKFSQLIRRTLHNSQFMFITLEEEIRSLHIYLQLEQMRFESKISYSIETAPGVIPAKLLVPPMMIQPLIENSILHGITPSGKNGVIKIVLRVKNNMLHCSVTDNGIGLKAAASSNHDGHQSTAIQNLRKRLDLLNRLYKTNATLEITEIYDSGVTQGTTALLIFPLQY